MATPKTSPTKPLTRKEQALVDYIVEHPKHSNTQAALEVYDTDDRREASVIAARTLARPHVKSELAKYSQRVESVLYNTVDEWGDHERPRQREIAQQAAMYIHDKVHGKATQRVETRSEVVNINISLDTSTGETPTG